MKPATEWLAIQTGDRPEDFAPSELDGALSWITGVQDDARIDLLAKLSVLRAAIETYLAAPTPETRLILNTALSESRP